MSINEQKPKSNAINFEKLIEKYKFENFQKMELINHQFLYCCAQPGDSDIVICLEKNLFPQNKKLYDLQETKEEEEHNNEQDEENKEGDEAEVKDDEPHDKSVIDFKDVGVEVKEVAVAQDDPNAPKADPLEKQPKKETPKEKFAFQPSINLSEKDPVGDKGRHPYAISKWKLNKGTHPEQVSEQGFEGCPLRQKFYISHDGQFIFFFLRIREEVDGTDQYYHKLVIMEIRSLKIIKEVTIPAQYDSIKRPALLNAGRYLYFSTYYDHYFFDVSNPDVPAQEIWKFYYYHYNDRTYESIQIKRVFFKAENPKAPFQKQVYIFADMNYTKYAFFKLDWNTIDENLFQQSNQQWEIASSYLPDFYRLAFNRNMTMFAFALYQSVLVTTPLNIQKGQAGQKISFKKQDNVYRTNFTKNYFLYDQLGFIAENENEEVFAFDINTDKTFKKYQLNDLYHWYKNKLGDVVRTPNENMIIIGQPTGGKSTISVNVIQGKDTMTNSISEMSSYLCLYPYIFYCKGNQEIFIQSLNDPEKLIRYTLEEEKFICFVELDPTLNFENQIEVRENETMGYLSEYKGSIHLNIMTFDQFQEKITFSIQKSKQGIKIGKQGNFYLGEIVKAVVLSGQTKDSNGEIDCILAIQYRNTIVIRSFFTKFLTTFDKSTTVPCRMIFQINQETLYLLCRDGPNIKIQKIKFDDKKVEECVTTLYTFKSNKINLFGHHEGNFYLMEENLNIRVVGKEEKDGTDYTHLYSLELNNDDKTSFEVSDYEYAIIANLSLYQGNKYYVLNKTSDPQKKINILSAQNIFNSNGQNQGPQKLMGSKSIFYITRGCDEFLFVDEEAEKEKQQEEEKRKKLEEKKKLRMTESIKTNKDPTNTQTIEIAKEVVNTQGDEVKLKEVIQEEEVKQEEKPKPKFEILDDEYASNEKMESIFLPFIDDNEICSMFNNKENDRANAFPQVQMSTFINTNEDILSLVGNKFFLFSKLGNLLQNVSFYEQDTTTRKDFDMSNNTLINISDNQQFYLFANNSYYERQLTVFHLQKVKTKQLNGYKFIFTKEVPVKKVDWSINYSYFDQIMIDDAGLVYQIQTFSEKEGQYVNDFKFYIDEKEDESMQKLQNSFSFIKKRITSKGNFDREIDDFGYAFIGNYLFIKQGQEFQYLKIWENNTKSQIAKTLNLNLDDVIIKRIVSCAEPSSTEKPDWTQIIFTSTNGKSMYVMTWDLGKNLEYQMAQIDLTRITKEYLEHPEHLIIKGRNEKLNYMVTTESFYDFQYMLPFRILRAEDDFNLINFSVNERKLSRDKQIYLGLGYKGSIFTSYTLLDLYYCLELCTSYEPEEWTHQMIKLEHLECNYDGNTIFHQYALNFKALSMIFAEVKRQLPTDEYEMVKCKVQEILFNVLYLNKQMESPFDIAVNNNSPKNIEIFLEMLISLPQYRLSQFVKKHFDYLFSLGLDTFETFLDTCFFQHKNMLEPRPLLWKYEEGEVYMGYHTSFLNKAFENQLTQGDPKLVKLPQKQIDKSAESASEEQKQAASQESPNPNASQKLENSPAFESQSIKGLSKSQTRKAREAQKMAEKTKDMEEMDAFNEKFGTKIDDNVKRVELCALEFDWVFEGPQAIDFIRKLAESDNDDLFALTSIRVLILFLWKKFFPKIIARIFLPFLIYFVLFLVYVTHVYEKAVQYKDDDDKKDFVWRLDTGFIIVLFILIAQQASIELIQVSKLKIYYFLSFWNLLDFSSLCLNIAFLIIDIVNVAPDSVRPLGAVAVLIMWCKFFYFLRLFQTTASIVRMIMQIITDMKTFSFVFLLAVLGFGNCFYILALTSYDYDACTPEVIEQQSITVPTYADDNCTIFTGANFLMALLYSFRTGTGDFSDSGYDKVEHVTLLWIVFIASAIIMQIILLNMLIAMMGDTFGRVTEIGEQTKLKEIASMIADNEFIVNRSTEFKNCKYIIYARLERAEGVQQKEGIIGSIKNTFNSLIDDMKRNTKNMSENLKEEIISHNRMIEQRIVDTQAFLAQQSLEIGKIAKDVQVLAEQTELQKEDLMTQFSVLQNSQQQQNQQDVRQFPGLRKLPQ